jgi:hypothetical protein
MRMQFEGAIARYARSHAESDREFEVRLSEASFTKSLIAELPNLRDKFPGSTIQDVQLAIDSDAMEAFVRLKRNGRDNTMRLRFNVKVNQGALVLSVADIELGTFAAPAFAVNAITSMFANKAMSEFTTTISSVASLTNIRLTQGVIIITGQLATGVTNGK